MNKALIIPILFTLAVCVSCANELKRQAIRVEEIGNYAAAIERWDKYLDRRPDDAPAYINRGFDKAKTGDLRGAIEDYSRAITQDSTYVLALFNRGINWYNLGNYALAVADFNAAVRIKGGDNEGNLPYVYVEWEENPAFRIEPGPRDEVSFPEILFERGLAYCGLDSLRRAFKDFNFCIDKGYLPDESLFFRGQIYERYGMREEAVKDYAAALRYAPSDGGKYTEEVAGRLRTLRNNKQLPR
jgi:tetratricopeptide (TPR) repeat protein